MITRIAFVILLMTSLSACLETVEKSVVDPVEGIKPSVQNEFFHNDEKENTGGLVKIEFSPTGTQAKPQTYFILSNQKDYFTAEYLKEPSVESPATLIPNLQEVTGNNGQQLPFASYGRYYSGEVDRGGVSHTFNIYSDNRSNVAFLMDFVEGDAVYMQLGGDSLTGSLPDGKQKYTGANFLTNTGELPSNEGRQINSGKFNMEVDFGNSKGNITATSEMKFNIQSGAILIDTSSGLFSGGDIKLVNENLDVGSAGREMKASIKGSFHGNNWNGVTGVYFENNDGDHPTLIGTIVGALESTD